MDNRYIVVLITAPSMEVAESIANALLEKKLAACANLIPSVRSLYLWQGAMNADQEVLLLVKSRADLFADHLVPAVKAVHPYDVPEIIALPIEMGSDSYLNWMDEVTRAQ